MPSRALFRNPVWMREKRHSRDVTAAGRADLVGSPSYFFGSVLPPRSLVYGRRDCKQKFDFEASPAGMLQGVPGSGKPGGKLRADPGGAGGVIQGGPGPP